jgi:hypothetical protein
VFRECLAHTQLAGRRTLAAGYGYGAFSDRLGEEGSEMDGQSGYCRLKAGIAGCPRDTTSGLAACIGARGALVYRVRDSLAFRRIRGETVTGVSSVTQHRLA